MPISSGYVCAVATLTKAWTIWSDTLTPAPFFAWVTIMAIAP